MYYNLIQAYLQQLNLPCTESGADYWITNRLLTESFSIE